MDDHRILTNASELKGRIQNFHAVDVPHAILVCAILKWEEVSKRDLRPEDFESTSFLEFVDDQIRQLGSVEGLSGGRTFAFKKLGSMVDYIASRGHSISRTKLNKLLFYSDFVNYFLHGESITGSRYVHLHYGPVAEHYRETLEIMEDEAALRLVNVRGHDELVAVGDKSLKFLTILNVATINWVLGNFGKMSAQEISDYSHREYALLLTHEGEFIPYRFASFLQKLPNQPPLNARSSEAGG